MFFLKQFQDYFVMLKEETGYILSKLLAHSHFALGNNILQNQALSYTSSKKKFAVSTLNENESFSV